MSKSNMLLGLAKGKVGDLVFYRDGGEQRTRTRVVPKNPRTPAQMSQRVKIANVSAMYRLLQPIVSNSFTNRKPNQSGYNAFAATAIHLAPALTKDMALNATCIPQPCHVSKGVLPSLPFAKYTGEDGEGFGLSVAALDGENVTCGEVSSVILENYPFIQQGDKITAVRVKFTADPNFPAGSDKYVSVVETSTFVVDATSTTPVSDTDFFVSNGYFSLSVLSELFDTFTQMAAYIISRKDANGALQVSTEAFTLSTLADTLYEKYRTPMAISDAVESYMVGTESIL